MYQEAKQTVRYRGYQKQSVPEVKGLRPYRAYETAPLFLALKYLCSTLSGQDCGYRPPLGHSRDPRRARGSGRCPGCPPATTGEMGVGGRFFTFLLGWGIGRYSGLRGSPGVPAMPSKCRKEPKPFSRHQIGENRVFCGVFSLIWLDATPHCSWMHFKSRLLAFTDALSLPVNHNTQLPAEPLFLSHPAGR